MILPEPSPKPAHSTRHSGIWLRISRICGLAPLFVGTVIFFAWLIFRRDALMLAGIMTIYIGLAVFLIGLLALAGYVWSARSKDTSKHNVIWRRAAGAALLLLANFPAAGAYAWLGDHIRTGHFITFKNEGNVAIQNISISKGPQSLKIPDVPPGTHSICRHPFESFGSNVLLITASYGVQSIATDLDDTGICGHWIITVGNDGQTKIQKDVCPDR